MTAVISNRTSRRYGPRVIRAGAGHRLSLSITGVSVVLALIAAGALIALVAAADDPTAGCNARRGRNVFMKCQPCHSVEVGGPHVVGPNLHGIMGRKAGTAPGYKYSGVFRQVNFTWERVNLDLYLQDPARFVGDNWMPFTGLKRAEDRQAVICYLEGLGSD
jgi:cytochrome c2